MLNIGLINRHGPLLTILWLMISLQQLIPYKNQVGQSSLKSGVAAGVCIRHDYTQLVIH